MTVHNVNSIEFHEKKIGQNTYGGGDHPGPSGPQSL
jgi:hypothetical protein